MNRSLLIAGAFLAASLGVVNQASAVVFSFSFANENGPVAGSVMGTIELPDGDGTFAATSVIVDSAPVSLGYTYPFDVLANLTTLLENTFTVVGGDIDIATSHFSAFIAPPPSILGSSFTLNGTSPLIAGSSMNVQLSVSPFTGVIDVDNSTLTFSSPTAVAEPGTLAALALGLGIFTLGGRRGRSAS